MRQKLAALITINILATVLPISGCSSKCKETGIPPTINVKVVKVVQRDVPVYSEWIGTLDGMVNAEIRAQVSGYLLRQLYREGSFVKRGQILFEIDPRPLQAALDQARGELAR